MSEGKNKTAEPPIFCNRIRLSVEGYNQNRLLGELLKDGIRIYSVQKESTKSMQILIDYKNRKKAFALIEKLCYNYKVSGVYGASPISAWLLSRIGLVVGLVAFSILMIISSSFIWRIDISGNEKTDSLTIMRKLSDLGVSVGKPKDFDYFSVSQQLNAIEGIVESTIEIVGTTVKVSVIESKEYIPPDNDETVGDIVSRYDAEITRVIVSGGTGKVGIGDRIAAGSVLISSEVFDSNLQLTGNVRAKGSVYGKVFFSDTAIISTTNEVLVRTGKKSKTSKMSIFGLSFGKKSKHSYASYQAVTTTSNPFLNTFLPFSLVQTTYYEVEKRLIETPIDELIDEYKRAKLLSLIINAGGSEVKTTITRTELANGLFSVNLYMEAEMPLGEFKVAPITDNTKGE